MAQSRHGAMSDLSPLSRAKWKLDIGAVTSVDDPLADLHADRCDVRLRYQSRLRAVQDRRGSRIEKAPELTLFAGFGGPD